MIYGTAWITKYQIGRAWALLALFLAFGIWAWMTGLAHEHIKLDTNENLHHLITLAMSGSNRCDPWRIQLTVKGIQGLQHSNGQVSHVDFIHTREPTMPGLLSFYSFSFFSSL
jgi:hypothetical protein